MVLGLGRKARNRTKREIIVNAESLETRVAILENDRLEEFQVEHPTEERIVGSIFKGRIQNLEHDLQAAFVNIGLKKNAFLHYWDMFPDDDSRLEHEEGIRRSNKSNSNRGGRGGRGRRGRGRGRSGGNKRQRFSNEEIEQRFPAGSEIVVQVTKGAIGTKGPRVTASLSLPGRFLVLMPGSKLKGVSRKIADGDERGRLKKVLARLEPPADTGLIVRTAGSGTSKRAFVRDLRGLIASWEELRQNIIDKPAPCCVYHEPNLVERVIRDWLTEDVDRIVVDNPEKHDQVRKMAGTISRRAKSRVTKYNGELPIFDHYNVEGQISNAFRRKVTLRSGAYLVFDETEALIAIDVNTGRHKGQGSQEQAILEVNTEAVEEVARQLRLRNIGGLVLIDLIDMKSRKHQNTVYRAMRAALRRDRARTNVLQISDLGIMEMTRQRAEESLLSSVYTECPYCRGRGEVKSGLAMSVELQRQIAAIMRKRTNRGKALKLQVVVHPSVLERLREEDEQVLIELQSRFEGSLSFRSDATRHVESFQIRDAETSDVLYTTVDH
ncbi:MAG: Rne/Rng family ribonuclease [Kiritimatiellae bacterium]|nr:Rne/Rng family ribonuclease [Kiritimatiellia bacterium]